MAGPVVWIMTQTGDAAEIQTQQSTQPNTSIPQNIGFVAEITGARTATISAPGIFFCIPGSARSSPGMVGLDLLVLADNQSARENRITFSIPRGKPPGTYKLAANPIPFPDVEKFEVRVELGSAADYFGKETDGTFTIDSMPEGTWRGGKSSPKGRFELETSNSKGERVKITGHFDFPAPEDESKYCQ